MPDNLAVRIDTALASVRNSRLGVNILEAGMVRDIATTPDGKVRFTVLLSAADDAAIVRDAAQGASVRPAESNEAIPKGKPRALPVMGQEAQSTRAAVPAPTPVNY